MDKKQTISNVKNWKINYLQVIHEPQLSPNLQKAGKLLFFNITVKNYRGAFIQLYQFCLMEMKTDVDMLLMACNIEANSADAPRNHNIDDNFTSGNWLKAVSCQAATFNLTCTELNCIELLFCNASKGS